MSTALPKEESALARAKINQKSVSGRHQRAHISFFEFCQVSNEPLWLLLASFVEPNPIEADVHQIGRKDGKV